MKTARNIGRTEANDAVLRREHDILQTLQDVAIPVARTLGLEHAPHGVVLVLADAGPQSLRERLKHQPFSIERFLPLAIELARTVAALHERQILHRDINPSNIVLDADANPTLIDFDAATRIIGHLPEPVVGELTGTLLYLAPEQTGRTNRGVDHRADLYALGATFYEILTGTPPFVLTDPVELVHAHLARAPVPPAVVSPEVPRLLSEIVIKLLAKEPEQRYQSADALRLDLERAHEQWRTRGTIDTFELGRADRAHALVLSSRLHGRRHELEQLRAVVERVARGAREIVTVSGPAGSGKSALLHELTTMLGPRGRVASGGAGQLAGDLPYAAWADGIRPLVREILDGPSHTRDTWCARLRAGVGRNVVVLEHVIPELAQLLGPRPPVPTLGPAESERRFHLTFSAFLRVLAVELDPLVVILDDLQWADPATLALLRVVASESHNRSLLLALAYREEQYDSGGLLAQTLEDVRATSPSLHLPLSPLDADALAELLADAMRCSIDTVRPITSVVLDKTAGNALFVRRFLQALHQRDILRFDLATGQWRWDVREISRAEATENVIDLMIEAIRRLPSDSQRLLRLAACLRTRVDLCLLATIAGEEVEVVAAKLWVAFREGLLVPSDDDPTGVSYRFAHDRIQEAAYGLCSPAERRSTHLRIGRVLRGRYAGRSESDLFEMVDQLDLGIDLLDDADERLELVQLNVKAAEKARAASAYSVASRYLRCATTLLGGEARWQSHRALAFRIQRDAAECAHLSGEHTLGTELATAALAHATSPFEVVDLANIQIVACSRRGELAEAIAWGELGLGAFELELPEDRVGAWSAELAAVEERVAGRSLTSMLAPRMEDPRQLACMELFCNLLSPAYVCDPHLLAFLAGRMVNLSSSHGSSVYSASGYAAFGMVVGFLEGDHATAHTVGHLGVALSRTWDDPVQECRAAHVFGCFVNHWRAPLRTSVPLLRRGIARGFEGGELEFAVYATGTLILTRFHMGDPLAEIAAEIENALPTAINGKIKAGVDYELAYRQAIRCLQGRTHAFDRFDDDAFDETSHVAACGGNPLSLSLYYITRLQTCFLARRFERAIEMSAAARPHLRAVWGIAPLPDHNLFTSLSLAALGGEGACEAIRENQRQLESWAESCPPNYEHKYRLVEAELARLEGRMLDAAAFFDDAIEGAERESALSDCAVANELAGRLWLGLGRRRIASSYLTAAIQTYAQWGASAKVLALEAEFPTMAYDPHVTLRDDGRGEDRRGILDILAIRKAAETISSEMVLERLLEKLLTVSMEVAGATRAALLLAQGDALVTRASTPTDDALEIPRSIIREAHDRDEPVVVGDAMHDPRLASDPIVRAQQTRSALALPVRGRTKPIGVLYLENHLAPHAFGRERVWLLTLLSSQIAISLQNSLLFEGLQLEVSERRRAESAVRFLADASVMLAESLDEEATLERATHLAVPFVADWCVVGIIGEDPFDRTLVAHVDPSLAQSMRERGPGKVARNLAVEVLEGREPRLRHTNGEGAQAELPPSTRSLMAVPLVARERALGVIVFGSARSHTVSDLTLAKELGSRVALAIDTARLYQQAQQAIGARDEFLSIASHELRTPLTSLRLATQRLLDATSNMPSPAVAETMGIMERQTRRLSSLVGDLLDVSRIHAGRLHLELEPVDLAELVRDVLARFEHQLRHAKTPVHLEVQESVIGTWDRSRLDQVFTNLVSNALKFGPGQPIEVAVATHQGRAKLTVRDHGCGIPGDRLPQIFDRFERAASVSSYGGLGLGLYISNQIVLALGGTITVQSELGVGSTFVVTLPVES